MDLKSTPRESTATYSYCPAAPRGAVQVGMMEVLLEHGIVPDALVGTSVGALNAAFLGWRPDRARVRELAARWMRLSTRDIFPGGTLTRMGHLLRQRPYLFSPAALSRLIDDWMPADELEDLPTPVRMVTTPLAGDTAVYHRHGDIQQLLLASAAVPAVFPPVCCRRAAATPACTSTAASPTSCRSAGRRPGPHPGLRPRCQRPCPSCRGGVRRSTSWSPASGWPPGSDPTPTSDPGRRTPDDHAGPRRLDDRLLLHRPAHRRRPAAAEAPGPALGREQERAARHQEAEAARRRRRTPHHASLGPPHRAA